MSLTMLRSLAVAAALVAGAADLATAAEKGAPAADFELKGAGGARLRLSSLHGKVVLLDFWASWCEPCKKELPLLAQMAKRLKPKGIEIVAVNIDDDKQKALDFMKTRSLSLTVVADTGKSIVGRWEPPKMPSSFAIDKNGVVRAVNGGFEPGDESKIEAQLTSLASK